MMPNRANRRAPRDAGQDVTPVRACADPGAGDLRATQPHRSVFPAHPLS
ncbi:hypothetical protein RS86_01754 [Microbacterium azadirachtae]|uniref:Uncharacterized protein n=1 Tax=Microbacterium azadirachtae TaxID=582680 RepID=A0A0F0LK63_9MICO|nr:hypothetical protein RS86_01754 [Microbacterium azadirachtae]